MALKVLIADWAEPERGQHIAMAFRNAGASTWLLSGLGIVEPPGWLWNVHLPGALDVVVVHHNNASLLQRHAPQAMAAPVRIYYSGSAARSEQRDTEFWMQRAITGFEPITTEEARQILDWAEGKSHGNDVGLPEPLAWP